MAKILNRPKTDEHDPVYQSLPVDNSTKSQAQDDHRVFFVDHLKSSSHYRPRTQSFSPMASTVYFTFSPILSFSKNPTQKPPKFTSFIKTPKYSVKIRAMGDGPDMVGDFGARDPFPAEIESNFSDKVLGNVNTEHKILIPNASALSLATQECVPVSMIQQALSEDEAKQLLFKVIGWRIVREEGALKLKGLWKLKDTKCAEELVNRINDAVESTGHLPTLYVDTPNQVRAELWTSSIGGLSMNDFIVAAKIDEIKTSDLLPRQRVWA